MPRRESHRAVCLVAVSLWLGALPCLAVSARRGPLKKGDALVDENAIFLENEYLRLAIATNHYAGQVMRFLYKPTGQELGTEKHHQGYCMDRMGEDRWFWKPPTSEGHEGEIMAHSDAKAVARVSYVWNYDHNENQTRIKVSKTYVLHRGWAALLVTWRLTNIGEKEALLTPWVKHLGGRSEKLLCGPTIIPLESGPRDPGGDFIKPAADWAARLSGTENTQEYPMVCGIVDYTRILQQFPWRGKVRFTLETILSRIRLAPGESWDTTYALAAMPNLGNIAYASPELAASAEAKGDLTPGAEGTVVVHISPARLLGEKRLEGEIAHFQGDVVTKLPNRQVSLQPGRTATVAYPFSPPGEGAYTISLTVFDEQDVYKLGQTVKSQRPSITLPLVVGPKPQKILAKWDSRGFSWPRREERKVAAWRTLANADALKAAQIRVPGRIYPEDTILHATKPEPARISAARGEYEHLQFVVTLQSAQDVSRLTVQAGQLSGPAGSTIRPHKLREAIYLATTVPSGYKNFPVGQWPDPLMPYGWEKQIPDAPITRANLETFQKARKRVFWLGLRVPRDAPPGLYRGQVALRLGERRVSSFPIEVLVRAFALPERPSYRPSTGMVGFKGGYANWQALGLSHKQYAELKREGKIGVDAFWAMALERGWTPTMWSGLARWKKFHDHGRGMTVFAGAGEKEEAWLKEHRLLDYAFVYAPFDEHANVEVPEVAEWCREFKKKSDVPILDCFYGSNVEPLFGLVDVWLGQSPRSDHWGQPTGPLGWGHKAIERKKAGDLFFACNSSLIWYIEFEPVSGRADFWGDFAAGYDGRYVYSTCRWTQNVYEKNWTSGNYMGCAVYPSPDGYATSIRLETLRDGVEDYDYLAVLRSALDKADSPEPQLSAQAREILSTPRLAEEAKTVQALHRMRNRVADLIEALAAE